MEGCTEQVEDCIGLLGHLLVGEAQDDDALTTEEGVAKSVASLSLGVGRTVHLDGHPRFDAKEVGKVVADGELSTELEAVDLSAAEPAPEERFGFGWAVAVPASEYDLAAQCSLHEWMVDSGPFTVSWDRHRITRPYRCTMRGTESKQSSMICLMSLATVVPPRHPLRASKEFVDAALAELGVAFDLMYAQMGRLLVDFRVGPATGTAERDIALEMVDNELPGSASHHPRWRQGIRYPRLREVLSRSQRHAARRAEHVATPLGGR